MSKCIHKASGSIFSSYLNFFRCNTLRSSWDSRSHCRDWVSLKEKNEFLQHIVKKGIQFLPRKIHKKTHSSAPGFRIAVSCGNSTKPPSTHINCGVFVLRERAVGSKCSPSPTYTSSRKTLGFESDWNKQEGKLISAGRNDNFKLPFEVSAWYSSDNSCTNWKTLRISDLVRSFERRIPYLILQKTAYRRFP